MYPPAVVAVRVLVGMPELRSAFYPPYVKLVQQSLCYNLFMDNTSTHYAGFWLRFWASIVDTAWVCFILFSILFAIYGRAYVNIPDAHLSAWVSAINWCLPAVLVLGFWFFRSATPGKIAIASKIVDANTGGKPKLWQFIVRYIAYILSIIPFCLGFIWIAFDPRKQAWHDKLASTVVIRDVSNRKYNHFRLWGSVIAVIIFIVVCYFTLGELISAAFMSTHDQKVQTYIKEGFEFGTGESSETCWQEMHWRSNHCPDLYCKYGQAYFLKACLAASAASRGQVRLNG